MKLAPRTVSGV